MAKRPISKRNNGRYLSQLYWSAFLYFFLPLTVLTIIFSISIYMEQKDEKYSAVKSEFSYFVDHLIWQLENATDIGSLLADNQTISTAYNNGDSFLYQAGRVQHVLDSLCNTNALIDDIYLYYTDDRWVYNRSSQILLDFYSRDERIPPESLSYITLSGQRFADVVLQEANHDVFIPLQEKRLYGESEDVLYYISPIYKKGAKIDLLCIVKIKMADLVSLLDGLYCNELDDPVVFLADQTHPLYSDADIAWSAFASLQSKPSDFFHLNGEHYFCQSKSLGFNNWQVVLLSKTNEPFWNKRLCIFLLGIISVLGIGILLIGRFINANYTSIHNIYEIAEQYITATISGKSQEITETFPASQSDEFQVIHQAISDMYNRVYDFSKKEKTWVGLQQREFWLDVINRKIIDEEEFQNRAHSLDIIVADRCWCILLANSIMPKNRYPLFEILREKLGHGALLYIHPQISFDCDLCVVSLPRGSFQLFHTLESTVQVITSEEETPTIWGIGQAAMEWEKISLSYFEAYTALDFCHFTGRRVSAFESIDAAFISTQKPFLDLTGAFSRAIHEGDLLSVHDLLRGLEHLFTEYECPLHNIRQVCFELYTITIDALTKLGKRNPSFSSYLSPSKVAEICLCDDAIDFVENLEQAIDNAFLPKQCYDMEKILSIVQERLTDPSFSFSQIAQEANMTNSTFTRLFQKHTGKLPMEYLIEQRMYYAKDLLENTDWSVLDISEKVGYYSVSSFVKRFKTLFGMTPGEYRISSSRRGAL